MGDQFNWQIEEESEEPSSQPAHREGQKARRWYTLVAILIIGALLGSWLMARERQEEGKRQLVESVQSMLDQEQQAFLSGDGDRYFSLHENDPGWFSAQLLPQNQAIMRAGLQATNAEENAGRVWANAAWNEQDEVLQRVLFFERRAGLLKEVATDPDYWGNQLMREEEWGNLTYYAVDDPWATSIASFIDQKIAENCLQECLQNQLPLTVNVRGDFQETSEPQHINIPSPHLLGLDGQGSPSTRFWQELGQRVHAQLAPAAIRFAVPPPRLRDGETVLPYRKLAEQFNALNPDITVEIITLDSYPEDASMLALEYDGAAILPTEEMLAAGVVHDLTDYVNSDPEFDAGDYYEQIWQGSLWRGRTWFMPEAAEMQVLYYDKRAYDRAGHSAPSSRWTWDEMAQDVSTIVADQPPSSTIKWGYLDASLDSLFSYAYNWNNQCSEAATILCSTPLNTGNIAAALEWYKGMANEGDKMPNLWGDLSGILSSTQVSAIEAAGDALNDEKRALFLLNFQGSARRAAVWVDSPVNYEFNFLIAPVGNVPFPGSDRFDGITPLWLHGSFISQHSEHPLAVWQWLKFLSYQSPAPRYIPARPSVAAEMRFWTILPQPLGDVMRTAFPFARPVNIEEKKLLTWGQVAAVVNGEMTPAEAARQQPPVIWFNQYTAEKP